MKVNLNLVLLVILLIAALESDAEEHCGYINGFPRCKNMYTCYCSNTEVIVRQIKKFYFTHYLGPKCCQKPLNF